jgi:UDP-N-acetylmuramoyl-tripeptide--D-alanyl-D-alanine ligase
VVQAQAWRTPMLYKVMVPGRHFAINGLAVLAAAHALRLDRARAVAALGRWNPGAGRGLRERILLDPVDARQSFELIDDAYNANPASLAASLEVLAAAEPRHGLGRFARGRRIAYLGDMKELGREEVALHEAVATLPAMARVDIVHCVGPLMRNLWKALPEERRGHWTEDAGKMAERVARDLDAGDVVLAKGSLSMGIGRVVEAVRRMSKAPAAPEIEQDV